MHLVKLQQTGDTDLYVNPDHVIAVAPHLADSERTVLGMTSGPDLVVVGIVEQVAQKLAP